jgi:hypothetical protein
VETGFPMRSCIRRCAPGGGRYGAIENQAEIRKICGSAAAA